MQAKSTTATPSLMNAETQKNKYILRPQSVSRLGLSAPTPADPCSLVHLPEVHVTEGVAIRSRTVGARYRGTEIA